MSTRIRVRSATEHCVPLPDGSFAPPQDDAEGIELERDLYIERRLAAGELEILPAPKPAKPAREG